MKESFEVENRHNDVGVTEAESFLLSSNIVQPQRSSQRRRLIVFFTTLNVGAFLLIYLLLRTRHSNSLFPNPFPSR